MPKGSMPVLVGAGQSVSHWDGSGDPALAPSARMMAVQAAENAIKDAGAAVRAEIDTIGVGRTNEDLSLIHI